METTGSDRPTSASGLGKLLPRALTEKRRRKKQQQHSDASSDDSGLRGRSPASSRHTADSGDVSNHSSFSIAEEREEEKQQQHHHDGGDDDDERSVSPADESQHLRPTAVSTHPSQIGYLTTSSPIVQEEHLKSTTDAPPSLDASSRSTTLPVSSPVERSDSLDSASSSSLRHTKTGLAVPLNPPSARRSSSPVGRLREALRSRTSNPPSSTGSPSPDRSRTPAPAPASDSELRDTKQPRDRDRDLDLGRQTFQSTTEANTTTTVRDAPLERLRSLNKGQKIDTSTPPRTPPNGDKLTPVIVNTPPTPTDHRNPHGPLPRPLSEPPSDAGPVYAEPATTLAHRRARSSSGNIRPSKLSNIIPAPLTPTPENGLPNPSTTGFFSSMISAAQNVAQNAATTLTNSIVNSNIVANNNSGNNSNNNNNNSSTTSSNNTSNNTKPRGPPAIDLNGVDSSVEVEPFPGPGRRPMEVQVPAVRTLGKGDLSLSQLGINDLPSGSATPVASRFPESMGSRARSESAPMEAHLDMPGGSTGSEAAAAANDSHLPASQNKSYIDPNGTGRTTPAGSIYEESTGIHRSGSVKSSLARHRKRGSSAVSGATGVTVGVPITATQTTLGQSSNLNNSTTKLTGFAIASAKRNREFHQLFKSVPDNDYLIEDYSCALQLQILAHGRLYVSEGHLCFNSNIFGYVTTLVMSFDEIVSVEKRSTALLFKNGLMISTLHAKHIFASFTSRDSTYDLIVKIWKLGHPSLQSSLNGVRLDETGGDKTEKIDVEEEDEEDRSLSPAETQSGSESDDEDDGDDVYDEDEEDELNGSAAAQPVEPGAGEAMAEKVVSRKTSAAAGGIVAAAEKPKEASGTSAGGSAAQDFPGPATHAKTDCGDADTHFDKHLATDTIPAPLGKVYDIMFGPASCQYMSKWLTGEQKCFDLQMDDKKGLSADNKSRTYSYTKPLNASLGPKQTKCIVTEHLDNMDLEKSVNVTCSTQTPDVPSGNVFSVKTRYCLSWDENNNTRVNVNCTTEWTGKSWIKGPIENGVIQGQMQYCKDLFASLKASVSSRARAGTGNAAVSKGKKKGRKSKTNPNPTSDTEGIAAKQVAKKEWGMLEPVHAVFSSIVEIARPLVTGNIVYGLLVGLLVASWFGFGLVPGVGRATLRNPYAAELGYLSYPDRLIAYEEMWRREESELWEWLEARVGMDNLHAGVNVPPKPSAPRQEVGLREVKEAIRVTEEKLKALKASMGESRT